MPSLSVACIVLWFRRDDVYQVRFFKQTIKCIVYLDGSMCICVEQHESDILLSHSFDWKMYQGKPTTCLVFKQTHTPPSMKHTVICDTTQLHKQYSDSDRLGSTRQAVSFIQHKQTTLIHNTCIEVNIALLCLYSLNRCLDKICAALPHNKL